MAPYTTEELTALHKRALNDAATLFTAPGDADFVRHLRTAAREIAKSKRPRTLVAALALAAGVGMYAAPTDLLQVKVADWGSAQQRDPWNQPRGPLPALRRVEDPLSGTAQILLSPAPSEAQISAYGANYPYYYLAAHLVPDSGASTITDRELDLLLLRAKVEALRELAIRNSNKPVSLRAGDGMSMGNNQTPPALYAAFLAEYNETQ